MEFLTEALEGNESTGAAGVDQETTTALEIETEHHRREKFQSEDRQASMSESSPSTEP